MAYIGNDPSNRFVAPKAASVFSGDGSTTAFTLDHAVGSDEDILVSVDGVIQEPSVAYAVSNGTTLTFTAAPSSNSGNNIFVYYLFRTVGTVSHPSNNALSATSGTFTGNVVIPDAGNIGSASDTDAISIASNGVVTFSQTPVNVGVSTLSMFRISSNVQTATSATKITAYADAHDSSGFKRIGTAWSESSGVFTPSASGLYEILFIAALYATSNNRYVQFDFKHSTNSGSDFTTHTMYTNMPHLNSGTTYQTITFPIHLNIATASTFRFEIDMLAEGTNVYLRGGSDSGVSRLVIKRIADAQ